MKWLYVALLLLPIRSNAQRLVDADSVIYSIQGADTTIIENPAWGNKNMRFAGRMPEASFDGDLKAYITRHTEYPDSLRKLNISGDVELYFEIDPAGTIGRAVVISNTHAALDAIALKMLRKMPRWKPAMMEGKAISSVKSLIIPFR